jgi:hypothetical protein
MRLKRIIIPVLFLLTGLFITGCERFQGKRYCSDYGAEELTLNETVDFRYSELYCNSEYEFRLSFDSLSDGRCPTGALCIWEGTARVKLHVQQSGKNIISFWLNTHSSLLTDTIVNGLHYELIDLLPYPVVDMDYSLDDYILQLKISD